MKNFKIVMILVAAVAMFCSCSKEGPTATFTEKNTTLTYDLYTADQMLLEFDGNITAEAGIKTLKVTRTTMDSTDAVKGDIILFTFEKEPEGETAYPFNIKDTLFKAQLAKGYKVVYDVEVADKKDQTLVTPVQYTINIVDNTPATTALKSDWSDPIYLTRPSSVTAQSSTINGTIIRESENTTIGVKILNSQTGSQGKAEKTSNCEGFVIVNTDDFASVEALEEAYNNAQEKKTELMLDFDYLDKNYSEMNFISKVDNTYVLVKYSKGFVYASNHEGNQGQVFGFKYKNAETAPVATK